RSFRRTSGGFGLNLFPPACRLVASCHSIIRRWGTLSEQCNAFQQVGGSFELRIVSLEDLGAICLGEALTTAPRPPAVDRTILLVAKRHDNVGSDAFFMNHLMARSVVLGRSQPKRRAVCKRDNALHRAFAERLFSQDYRAVQILEAAS